MGWEIENTTHLREELRVEHLNRNLDGKVKSSTKGKKGYTVEKVKLELWMVNMGKQTRRNGWKN